MGSAAVMLAIGLLSHIFADKLFGYVPFFWPIQPFVYPSMIHTKSSKMALKSLEAAGLIYLACTLQLHVFFCVIFSLHPFPYPQLFSSLTLFVERSVCTSIL